MCSFTCGVSMCGIALLWPGERSTACGHGPAPRAGFKPTGANLGQSTFGVVPSTGVRRNRLASIPFPRTGLPRRLDTHVHEMRATRPSEVEAVMCQLLEAFVPSSLRFSIGAPLSVKHLAKPGALLGGELRDSRVGMRP